MIGYDVLQHRCTIQTNTGSTAGGDGHIAPSWADTYEDVPCSFQASGGRAETWATKEALVADFTLKLLPDQTVDENDRVADVTLRAGGGLFATATFKVIFVRPIEDGKGGVDHLMAYLEMVR